MKSKKQKLLTRLPVICVTLLLAVALVFPVACAQGTGTGTGGTTGKVYTLKYETTNAAVVGKYLDLPFAQDVEKMSGGRLKIEVHYAGEIVPAASIPDAVRDKILDIGWSWGGYTADRVPLGVIINGFPVIFDGGEEANTFLYDPAVLQIIRDEYKKLGYYYLGAITGTQAGIVSRKPIKSLDDWRKMTTRSSGVVAEYLGTLGIPTTFVAGEEVYGALDKGVVDAAMWGAYDSGISYGFFEVAKYFLDDPMMQRPAIAYRMVNLDVWNSLPADLQAILEVANHSNSGVNAEYYARKEGAAKLKATTELGITLTTLPDSERQLFAQKAVEYLNKLAARDPASAKLVEMLKVYPGHIK